MKITVAWVTPRIQDVVTLELPAGATLADAVLRSGFVTDYRLDPATIGYAVFGRRTPADAPLADGDRVELTRALAADPKAARSRRAREKKLGKPRRPSAA